MCLVLTEHGVRCCLKCCVSTYACSPVKDLPRSLSTTPVRSQEAQNRRNCGALPEDYYILCRARHGCPLPTGLDLNTLAAWALHPNSIQGYRYRGTSAFETELIIIRRQGEQKDRQALVGIQARRSNLLDHLQARDAKVAWF